MVLVSAGVTRWWAKDFGNFFTMEGKRAARRRNSYEKQIFYDRLTVHKPTT
jgi:hypothetical protein